MVSFGEKVKIKRREIWIKVVVMFLLLYYLMNSLIQSIQVPCHALLLFSFFIIARIWMLFSICWSFETPKGSDLNNLVRFQNMVGWNNKQLLKRNNQQMFEIFINKIKTRVIDKIFEKQVTAIMPRCSSHWGRISPQVVTFRLKMFFTYYVV